MRAAPAHTRPKTGIRRVPWFDLAQMLVLVGGLFYLVMRGGASLNYNWQWYRVPKLFYRVIDGELLWGPLIDGLMVTFEITAWALPLAILIGLVTALLRRSNSTAGRAIATAYLEVIRSTPILVQVYIFYFIVAPVYEIGAFWACVLALAFHEGSFTAEIFRSGINSVQKGQWEASDTIALTALQKYRYVVLPQAIPLMIPPMTGQVITLIKHSSILSAVAIFDLTTMALDLVAETFMAFEIWLTVGLMYLVITGALSIGVSIVEWRIRRRFAR